MKRLSTILLCFLLIVSMEISVYAASSVPEPVMKATESVVRVLAEYADGYATGSGFVIKSDKEETLIATNYHVVEGNPYSISVWLSEEETVSATILAYTNQKDMCILKLAYPVSMKPLAFSDSGAKQGQAVYAVGFPGAADYLSDKEAHTSADATITDGIVSAVREATVSSHGTPTKILQINAAINPGNSGGPLFNINGEVVGINTYKINDSQGIFGAIDVSELKTFIADRSILVQSQGKGVPWFVLAAVSGGAVVFVIVLIIMKRKRRPKTLAKDNVKPISLRQYMESYPNGIGIYDAVALLLPVALQLRDLHNNGCTHLQVSPDSVLIDASGTTLHTATAEESDRYISGYAAPEIYKGTSAGNRSDIYSFCAVLFYAVFGNQPMNALSRTESDHITCEDEAFAELLKTGMALDAADRFATMQDVIINLSRYNVRPFQYVMADAKQEKKTVGIEKRHVAPKKIVIVTMLIVGVLLIGSYFGCYFGARINAQNGNFAMAQKLLFLPGVTKIHDSQLVAYVEAGCLLDARKYDEARSFFESLTGYMNADALEAETRYRGAFQCADKGEFSMAVKLLDALAKEGYKDAGEKVKDIRYRWAWALVDEGEYTRALFQLESIRGHADVTDSIEAVTELIYQEGKTLYYEKKFATAKSRFEEITSYADSRKYLTLAEAQCVLLFKSTAEMVDELIDIFYFEDASQLLLSKDEFAEEFLCGTWRGDGYYFTMEEGGGIRYNLPRFDYGDYYKISNGEVLLFPKNKEYDTKKLFHIEAITPDCIEVFCYKNNRTYTLSRQ